MRVLRVSLCLLCLACAGRSKTPPNPVAPLDTTRKPITRMRVEMSDSFRPQMSDSALRAFVPAFAPTEVGGECRLIHPTPKVTLVTAAYPSFDSSETRMMLTFDSEGRLVRFIDSRGYMPRIRIPPDSTGKPPTDSAFRAALERRPPQTTIQLDFPLDQGLAINSAPGKPTEGVITTIAGIEKLEKFGPPSKRILRARKLCGV